MFFCTLIGKARRTKLSIMQTKNNGIHFVNGTIGQIDQIIFYL
jgi:hypothetical protein